MSARPTYSAAALLRVLQVCGLAPPRASPLDLASRAWASPETHGHTWTPAAPGGDEQEMRRATPRLGYG